MFLTLALAATLALAGCHDTDKAPDNDTAKAIAKAAAEAAKEKK